MTSSKPSVYFIGAGPGDPDLLTLKAYKVITKANVILYADSLVPKQILKDAREDAELIPTGNKTLESDTPISFVGITRIWKATV